MRVGFRFAFCIVQNVYETLQNVYAIREGKENVGYVA